MPDLEPETPDENTAASNASSIDASSPVDYPVPELPDVPDDDYQTGDEPGRPRGARGAIVIGARIVTGVIGVVIAVVVIAVAGVVPLPTLSTTPASVSVVPVPASQQLVCAGPLLRLGSDSGTDATSASSIGSATVRSASSAGDLEKAPLKATENTSGVKPTLLTLPPVDGANTTPLLAGSQTQTADQGDLVGLAASSCAESSGDSWLVGGATTTGRTTLLTLSNPSTVNATVTLSIFGETGPISATGADGIVVPPGSQRIFSLAGFAPDVVSPVVHVQSRGGQIVANLQQSVVRTLQPGGVDIVDSAAAPSKVTVITGIVIANSVAVTATENGAGFDDLRSIIRVLAPGSKAAKVSFTVTPETGGAGGATSEEDNLGAGAPEDDTPDAGTSNGGKKPAQTVELSPGVVTELPLGSFPDGAYTVTIHSDQPVVAAARTSNVGSTGATDFAWAPATSPVSKSALVTIAAGPSPVLHLSNPTTKAATVTLISKESGSKVTIAVPAGKAVQTALQSSTTYTVSGFDRLMGSVSYIGDGTLAGFPIVAPEATSQPVIVYP